MNPLAIPEARRTGWVLACLLPAFCASAGGQIVAIGPFVGEHREDFEAIAHSTGNWVPCFGGQATAKRMGGWMNLVVTAGFGSACGSINGHGHGHWFLLAWTGSNVEWFFSRPVKRFGGYFAANCQQPGGIAKFYNEFGTLVAVLPLKTSPDWAWNGWEAQGRGIKRVRIFSTNPAAGRIMHDNLELTFDCYPDCNANMFLGPGDFACFHQKFVAQDIYADCNGDSALTIADLGCFQAQFVAGCP